MCRHRRRVLVHFYLYCGFGRSSRRFRKLTSLRITVITADFPPARGGVADYTAAWMDAMRARGHQISVITSTEGALGTEGVSLFRGSWRRKDAAALAALVRNVRTEVLVVQYVPHAFSPRGGGIWFALLIRALVRQTRVPLVLNAHEIYGGWRESLKRVPWHAAQRVATAVLLSSSSAFVVTVRERKNNLVRLFRPWRDRIQLLPIGPTILPTAPDEQWRQRNGINDQAVVVSTLGLGHPSYDVAQFVSVLDRSIQQGVDLRLFVGGRLKIEHPLATNLGFLDSRSAAQLLSASDIFALPLTDGISGRRSSAISALASGSVVVSTAGKETDAEFFLNSGVTLTPAGDSAAFAASILRVAQDSRLRDELRAQSRRFFHENFAWETVALQWEDLLASVVAEDREA